MVSAGIIQILKFASSNSKHKRKLHFCLNYLQGFHSEQSRDNHFKHCKENEAVMIEMPKKVHS